MAYDAKQMLKGYVESASSLEDMLSVRGKVAIVTGGISGLGFCTAQRLCQGGAKVVISGLNREKAAYAVELLQGKGYEVAYYRADMKSEEDVKNLVDFTAKQFGSVDILVTAAGQWGFGHVYDLSEAEFKRLIDINLVGAFRCVKHVSRYMIDHEIHGKIVLVSSNSAWMSDPVFGGYPHYVASKGGVVAMTQELGKELKRFGITVNSVAPGPMATPGAMVNGPAADLPPEKKKELMEEIMVNQHDEIPTADSVAIVIYGMCTRLSDGIIGETVVADSGHMRNICAHQPAIKEYPPKKDS